VYTLIVIIDYRVINPSLRSTLTGILMSDIAVCPVGTAKADCLLIFQARLRSRVLAHTQ